MTPDEIELYAMAGLQADPCPEEARFLDAVIILAREAFDTQRPRATH